MQCLQFEIYGKKGRWSWIAKDEGGERHVFKGRLTQQNRLKSSSTSLIQLPCIELTLFHPQDAGGRVEEKFREKASPGAKILKFFPTHGGMC